MPRTPARRSTTAWRIMAWLMAPAAATITGTCEMDGAVSATPLRFSRGNCQAFLQTVQGTIELNGLIATVSANFTYKNEKKSIEAAVLSLPMPKQAILQGYELQDIKGHVQESSGERSPCPGHDLLSFYEPPSALRVPLSSKVKGGEEVILRMEYLLVLQA
ncbi:VWFA domain-containing protein, partial [Durusdinium trenchii]